MLKGIDVSSWNGRPFNAKTEAGFAKSDFVVVKATQGVSYVNPCCDYAVQRTLEAKKLMGYYHYAEGGDPKGEAAYFYENTRGYTRKGIPCLDWEAGENASFGSRTWAWDFCREFHRLSGVWPMVYVMASAVGQVGECAGKCALWLAGYPANADSWAVPPMPYGTGAWECATLWQYTSGGGLDRNVAYVDAKGWRMIAGAAKPKASLTKRIYTLKLARYMYPSAKADKEKRIMKLGKGTVVQATGLVSGDWMQVTYGGRAGWIKMHAAVVKAVG